MIRPARILEYSAPAFNRLVDFYFYHRILQVLDSPRIPWRFPWYTEVRWDRVREAWVLRVTPGACLSATGDGDPRVTIPAAFSGRERVERLGLPPEVRELQGSEAMASELVDAWLSEVPAIPVRPDRWRAIGTDAAGTSDTLEGVPQFFAAAGVAAPVVTEIDEAGGLVQQFSGLIAERRTARLLRAVDLVVSHDRLQTVATVSESATVDGVEIGASTVRPPGYEGFPRLEVMRQFIEDPEADVLAILRGLASDTARDRVRVATVYLLSPEGADPGSVPDETWSATVAYYARRTLQYLTRVEEVTVEPTRLSVPLPSLGQGALGRIGGAIASGLNAEIAQMEGFLIRSRNEGRFFGQGSGHPSGGVPLPDVGFTGAQAGVDWAWVLDS